MERELVLPKPHASLICVDSTPRDCEFGDKEGSLMIDFILAVALTVGTLAGPIVQGPVGPAGPIPIPPTGAINSAQ